MKKLSFVLAISLVINGFGQNPNSNRNLTQNPNNNNYYSNFFEYERDTQRKVDADYSNYKEKVQTVNMSELIGKTFIFNNKAYIIPRKDILYIGKVNNNGTIDLEKEIKFKKLDDNCISLNNGKTCFTIRSKTMLPEIIDPKTGRTLSIGKWKDEKFHQFLLKWKDK